MFDVLTLFATYPGILPHDGRNISFKELSKLIRATCNVSPSLSFFVPNYAANMLKKSYSKDTFNLDELNLHNGIEHDASLTSIYAVFHDAV